MYLFGILPYHPLLRIPWLQDLAAQQDNGTGCWPALRKATQEPHGHMHISAPSKTSGFLMMRETFPSGSTHGFSA